MCPRAELRCRQMKLVAGLLASLLAAAIAAPGQEPARTGGLVPQDAFLTVTVRDGQRRVKELHESRILNSYLQSPAFASLEQQSGYLQAKGGLYMFAGIAGMEPWPLAGQLIGEELTLALGLRADSEKPYFLAVMKPADADAAQRILNAALTMTGALVDGQPVEARSREIDGVRGYSLNPQALIASFDEFVVLCNQAETLEQVIRRRGAGDDWLAAQPLYRRAAEAVPKDAAAWAYLALDPIRKAAGEDFDKKLDNALAAMLLGGWIDAVRRSDAVVAWVEAAPDGLSVSGRLIGSKLDDERLRAFFVGAAETRDWPRLAIPGLIGQIELTRDWTGLWDAREAMMNAEGMRGLLNFANTLTTLMGSLDFSSELLPELRPTLRFLAARQRFDGQTPTPELPGFALLLHMKDPGKLTPRLENAALMAMSIINVERGQKMQPQYRMELAEHNGTRMLTAKFAEKTEPGPRGTRFNFEPSVAALGDRFVICTSRRMLEDLIDALPALPQIDAGAATRTVDLLKIDLRELRGVFEANRELFITNRMLEADLERERAARQVGMVLDAAKMLMDLSVHLEATSREVTFSARLGLTAIE